MWWPRGWRSWWWYMNPYMYLPYPAYAPVPQQPTQPSKEEQPTQSAIPPYYPPMFTPPFMPPPPTPEQEIEALETYKADIEEELKGIEARLKELKESLTKKSSE